MAKNERIERLGRAVDAQNAAARRGDEDARSQAREEGIAAQAQLTPEERTSFWASRKNRN